MKGRSRWADWRTVRVWEGETRQRLRRDFSLRLHGWAIGGVVLLAMWATAWLQMRMGVDSLALRYVLTLGAGYLVFLGVLRAWAGLLVGEDRAVVDATADAVDAATDVAFDAVDLADVADAGSAGADLAGGIADAAAGSDEGALVVIPVLAVFALACLVLFGAGSLLLLYFGAAPCWRWPSRWPSATPARAPR